MIDKVEVRIPRRTEFSRDFAHLYEDISRDPDAKVFRESRYYLGVGDLRRFGHRAVLHHFCKLDKQGNHKLELLDSADLSYKDIQLEIMRIFNVDPGQLSLTRLDLAADVPGLPVRWFQQHARVKGKQWEARFGCIEYAEMGRHTIGTLYYGKRPNCLRIYDKIAELKLQYDRMNRRTSDALELPTFEEQFHYPESGFVLTRVERQIAGGRLPDHIATIRKMRQLPDFNPFDRLELLPARRSEPRPDDYHFDDYLKGLGLREIVNKLGLHEARSFVNSASSRNASRYFKRYQAFLSCERGIDEHQLFRRYQESVQRQLAG